MPENQLKLLLHEYNQIALDKAEYFPLAQYIHLGDNAMPVTEAIPKMQATLINKLVIAIGAKLRDDPCPHGLPDTVFTKHYAQCKPLCDACALKALRELAKTITTQNYLCQ